MRRNIYHMRKHPQSDEALCGATNPEIAGGTWPVTCWACMSIHSRRMLRQIDREQAGPSRPQRAGRGRP